MKKILLSLFIMVVFCSCNSSDGNFDDGGRSINSIIKTEYSRFYSKMNTDCGKSEEVNFGILNYIGERAVTDLEDSKHESCKLNISDLSCDSEAITKKDLSLVPDCLYYENTKGFPTAKTSCEINMTGFCQSPRSCVDGVSCEVYQGGMPFRKGCAEPSIGEYTCTGDYDNAPFCKPFWVEYTSGCHDEAGYVKENSFDDLCDKFGNVLLIEDDSIVEQFNNCFNAIPHQGDYYTCEDLYDINYDISTITECQFIFAE